MTRILRYSTHMMVVLVVVTRQVDRPHRVRTEATDPRVTKIPIARRRPALNLKFPIGNPKTIQKETDQAATVVVAKATVLAV